MLLVQSVPIIQLHQSSCKDNEVLFLGHPVASNDKLHAVWTWQEDEHGTCQPHPQNSRMYSRLICWYCSEMKHCLWTVNHPFVVILLVTVLVVMTILLPVTEQLNSSLLQSCQTYLTPAKDLNINILNHWNLLFMRRHVCAYYAKNVD